LKGKPYYEKGAWGVKIDAGDDLIAADIFREDFWNYIVEGK